MHRLQDMVGMHRRGVGARAIARALNMSPNTERRYRQALEAAELLWGPADALPELTVLKAAVGIHDRHQEVSTIEKWRDVIQERVEMGATARPIYQWLKANREDFAGSYDAVKRMVRRIQREQPVRPGVVSLVLKAEPGKEAQVDFGYVGVLFDPVTEKMRRAWVFVMTLSFSRHMFVKAVFDQSSTTWLELHMDAFAFFGAVPERVVPDNLKAAVIRAAFDSGENPELNRSYRELARHYGFVIDPTPPYAPNKKGKVERSVGYVKRSFFDTWDMGDIHAVNQDLLRWNHEVASVRVHGTTHKQPIALFEEVEKPAMRPLPTTRYQLIEWRKAKVHTDSHIQINRQLYSVPFVHVGKEAWVKFSRRQVEVFIDDVQVAVHDRSTTQSRITKSAHLPTERLPYLERSEQVWTQKAAEIGPNTHLLVRTIFEDDDAQSQIRKVQYIVSHLSRFPKERAEAACRRALHFENLSGAAIRKILRDGLDFQPLDEDEAVFGRLENPTHARTFGLLGVN